MFADSWCIFCFLFVQSEHKNVSSCCTDCWCQNEGNWNHQKKTEGVQHLWLTSASCSFVWRNQIAWETCPCSWQSLVWYTRPDSLSFSLASFRIQNQLQNNQFGSKLDLISSSSCFHRRRKSSFLCSWTKDYEPTRALRFPFGLFCCEWNSVARDLNSVIRKTNASELQIWEINFETREYSEDDWFRSIPQAYDHVIRSRFWKDEWRLQKTQTWISTFILRSTLTHHWKRLEDLELLGRCNRTWLLKLSKCSLTFLSGVIALELAKRGSKVFTCCCFLSVCLQTPLLGGGNRHRTKSDRTSKGCCCRRLSEFHVHIWSCNCRKDESEGRSLWLCNRRTVLALVQCSRSHEGSQESPEKGWNLDCSSFLLSPQAESNCKGHRSPGAEVQSNLEAGWVQWTLSISRQTTDRLLIDADSCSVDQLVVEGGYKLIEQFCYDHDQYFSHEDWRGRMKTCNGVGSGSLPESEVKKFDEELKELLRRKYPKEPLLVPHRVWGVVVRAA